MRHPVFPDDTMVMRGTVTAVGTDDAGCGFVELNITMHVGDTDNSDCDVRVAIPRSRRQPVGAERRALEALNCEDAMDLDFTPEQDLLRETVAGVCQRYCDLKVVREMEDDPVGFPDKLWAQLADLGLIGLTLPEEYGGTGMSMLDAVIVYTEFGRALTPSPHFVSSVMSGGVLAARGLRRAEVAGGSRRSRRARRSSRPRGWSPAAGSGRRASRSRPPPTATDGS